MQRNRRFGEVMAGLFLLVLGLAALGGGEAGLVAVAIALAGFYLLARQFDRSRRELADGEDEMFEPDATTRQAGAEQVYAHAIQAVKRAGLDPAEVQVLPVDIGVMAFRADRDPVVHRSQPVLDDVDYIQPFVQLRLPQRAAGRIRFEIADSDGQVLFIHEDNHQLERGRNLITPAARLPIHDAQAMQDRWELRVSADGVPIAAHRFGWRESADKTIRRHLREDGEMTADLRAALQDSQPRSLSLDELLAGQEEAEQRARQR